MKTSTGIRNFVSTIALGLFPVWVLASPTAEPSPEPTEVVIAMNSTEPTPTRPLKPLDTKPPPFPSTRPMDRNPGSLPPIPVPDRPKPGIPEPSVNDTADGTGIH